MDDLYDSSDDDRINGVLQAEIHFPQQGDSSSTSIKIEGKRLPDNSNEGTATEVWYFLHKGLCFFLCTIFVLSQLKWKMSHVANIGSPNMWPSRSQRTTVRVFRPLQPQRAPPLIK